MSEHQRSMSLADPGGKHGLESYRRRKPKPSGMSTYQIIREDYIRVRHKASWIRCSETSKVGGQRSARWFKKPGRQLFSVV